MGGGTYDEIINELIDVDFQVKALLAVLKQIAAKMGLDPDEIEKAWKEKYDALWSRYFS